MKILKVFIAAVAFAGFNAAFAGDLDVPVAKLFESQRLEDKSLALARCAAVSARFSSVLQDQKTAGKKVDEQLISASATLTHNYMNDLYAVFNSYHQDSSEYTYMDQQLTKFMVEKMANAYESDPDKETNDRKWCFKYGYNTSKD